jgi:hypothetical protein
MMRSILKWSFILIVLLLVVSLGALGWMKLAPRRTPEGQPSLLVLDTSSLDAFRRAFNEGAGNVRILVMLSPT